MSLHHRFAPLSAALLAACVLLPASSLAQLSFAPKQAAILDAASTVYTHADFNGDGREDIIVNTYNASSNLIQVIYLSTADGTYDAPKTLPASVQAIGDFNADGKLDFATIGFGGNPITVYLGNGDGTFQAAKVSGAPNNTVRLLAADLNHDGKTDLIEILNGYSPGPLTTIQLFLSNGDGTFHQGESIVASSGTLANQTTALAVTGDFDGDGKPDVALIFGSTVQNANFVPVASTVAVYYGDGLGNLGTTPTLVADPNKTADNAAFAFDLNNDGISDIVTVASSPKGGQPAHGTFSLFFGNAHRTLSNATLTNNDCAGPDNTGITAADFNGDGINDLAYTAVPCNNSVATSVYVRLGTGAGAFGPEQNVYQNLYQLGMPLAVRTTLGTRPDLAFNQFNGNTTGNFELLTNTSTGNFPSCSFTAGAEGVTVCSPGANSTSPATFSIATAGPTVMRTAAVWVDGAKVKEQYAHAFSNYSFLDTSFTLGVGPHAIAIYGTGWDDTLQKKTFTLTVNGPSSGGSCTAPTSAGVNICAPGNYTTVASPVTVSAAATVTGTLQRMEVWIDGVKKYTETTSNAFSTSFVLAPGTHAIAVYAANTAGGLWENGANITVSGSTGCTAPGSPGVNVCAPVNGGTIGSPVTVTAASTLAGTLARMEIWVDGKKKFTETTSTSFSTTLSVPTGSHRFTIYSVNTAGTKYETSVTATVK